MNLFLGTLWDHPRAYSLVSRDMEGQEKNIGFSDFGLYIENFQKLNLAKVLFLLLPPKILVFFIWLQRKNYMGSSGPLGLPWSLGADFVS